MSSVDRGYAWVIPFSCFFIQATLFGTFRSYGLLYKVLLDSFDISRSNASWPFSLCMTMIHLTGPISGSLNKYFSVRSITFTGCFLSAVGTGLCFWSGSSIAIIVLGIGVIQGFGIGLTYVQNNAIINQYFIEYRATANGISLSGGTIGAFIISPILESSLRNFPFHDCFLILSGVMLLTLPFCLLLRPFRGKDETPDKNHVEKGIIISQITSKQQQVLPSISATSCSKESSPHPQSAVIPASSQYYASNILNSMSLSKGIYLKSYNMIKDDCCHREEPSPPTPIVTTEQILMPHSLSNMMTAVAQPVPVSSRPTIKSPSTSESFSSSVRSIVSDGMFLLIAVTHMSYFWASITYCMIVVDFAQDKGIGVTDSVDLISSFSMGDLIGRFGSGFLLDKKVIPLQYVAMISSIGIGVFMNTAIVAHGYWSFVVISAALGFLSGIIVALLNQLFCKYVGSEKAALAFGISAFLAGAVTTVRPLVVGSFRDQKDGSYDGLFISLGVVCVLAGLLWLIEPMIAGCRRNQKEKHLLVHDTDMITPVMTVGAKNPCFSQGKDEDFPR